MLDCSLILQLSCKLTASASVVGRSKKKLAPNNWPQGGNRLFRQRMKSIRQRLYVSSPTSKIPFEIILRMKCIYKLPEEYNVTFDAR